MISHSNTTHRATGEDTTTRRRWKGRGVAFLGAGLLVLTLLVAAGMGMGSRTARADGSTPIRVPARTIAVGGLLGPSCPKGTVLVIFDQPVYDDNGLFVIGTTPVPYCVPVGLEPAG